MPLSPLHEFIDEEMLRAPMTLDLTVDAVQEQWRVMRMGFGRDRSDPSRVLQNHRGDLVQAALTALRESVQTDLGEQAPPAAAASPAARLDDGALSLIDEDAVNADIEVARCIEAIKLQCEAELRELQTYTSALVGDPNVSRDSNPFRPELMVRALWRGAQALPLTRATQAAFMRDAAEPLAKALKQAYAAAAERLDERGITPAAHRTIVFTGGTLYGSKAPRYRPPADLNAVRDSLAAPLDAVPMPAFPSLGPSDAGLGPASAGLGGFPPIPVPAGAAGGAPAGTAAHAAQHAAASAADPALPGADPQLILLLTRLFDEIQADRSLSADLGALLLRLQPAALRVALVEPQLLDTYDHPVWRFMDSLAHTVAMSPPAERLRVLGLGRNLVDHLSAADSQDGERFRWATDRLAAMNRHALAQALAAAQPEIERLRRRAASEAPVTTASMPLDIAHLDTVPAELMPEHGPINQQLMLQAEPGDHLRAWLQGDWHVLQLLWASRDEALWVLREPSAERLWAVRPAALDRLLAEQLAQPLHQRSLVRRAAERVLRAL